MAEDFKKVLADALKDWRVSVAARHKYEWYMLLPIW